MRVKLTSKPVAYKEGHWREYTVVSNAETGEMIQGVIKAEFTADCSEGLPILVLHIVNPEIEIETVEEQVQVIKEGK